MTIGRSVPRPDAAAKTTGSALYPGDLKPGEMLHAVIVFTDQPHGRLVGMDISAAVRSEGVVTIVTAADIPMNEYGLTMFDQPVLVGVDGTGASAVPSDISRWEGDQVAVVVATTVAQARRAATLITMEWDDLGVVSDTVTAMAEGALLIHPENGLPTNEFVHYKIRKGDPSAVWDEAAVVIEADYSVPHQEHAYLQPEAALSYIDSEGRVTVEIGGQWTHEDQEQIAHALQLPASQIRVIYPAIGGAFGGREDMSMQIVLAAAALKCAATGDDRPIRCQWSREESIIGHHKRHRATIHTKWAADAAGNLMAVEADAVLDAGAYNYTSNKVLGNLHLTLLGPYRVANAHIDSRAVYTNTVPGGAFRGFGAPQGAFVAESQMNKLAVALGLDPVEMRRRNLLRDGDDGPTQTVMPAGVSIDEVVAAAARQAGWGNSITTDPVRSFRTLPGSTAATRSGRGFACAFKNIGFSFGFPERCEAAIELHGDGDEPASATLFHSAAEVGQGTHTALTQMAAQAVGLEFDRVDTVFSDTARTGDSGSVSASRMTFMAGNAILGAAEEAQKAWLDGARPARGEFKYVPPPTEVLDPDGGPSVPNFCYGYVAQAVDVAVDIETGHVRVDRVVSAVDVGKAINPQLIVGQTEGAVVQAHGYTLTENLVVRNGRTTNPRLSQYLIPGIGDIPGEVETVIVESDDPIGPFGVRGMAEMPFIPYAPAVVAALFDATGVWFDQFPLTPDRVLSGLQAAGVS